MTNDMLDGIGTIVEKIDINQLDSKLDACIQDVKTIASFSWMDTAAPTIQVPGAPFLYKRFAPGLTVRPDTGHDFVDQALARSPEGRLLAPFEAIRHTSPGYDFQQHDIIVERGNLKKLQMALGGHGEDDFRIDIECNGAGGLLFNKWSSESIQDMQRSGTGYRMNFDQATRKPLEGSEDMITHSRCISYDFNGLNLLVFFEVDGFIDEHKGAKYPLSQISARSKDDLASLFESLQVSQTNHDSESAPGSTLQLEVIETTFPTVPHASLIEMKTRNIRGQGEYVADKLYAQAFWAQMPVMITAYHQRGRFMREESHGLSKLAANAHAGPSISKVAALLHKLISLIGKEKGGERFCLIPEDNQLTLLHGGKGVGITSLS